MGPAPLRQFYLFGGRPDAGKTTFVSDNLRLWGQEVYRKWRLERPILILNNEGATDKYQRRLVQGATGLTTLELIDKGWEWAKDQFNQLVCPFGNENMADDLIQGPTSEELLLREGHRVHTRRSQAVHRGVRHAGQRTRLRGHRKVRHSRYSLRVPLPVGAKGTGLIEREHFALNLSQLNSGGNGRYAVAPSST